MSEETNKKGLLIITVILWLVVLGLCGWMVYDRFTNKEEPIQHEVQKPNEEDNQGQNNNQINNLSDEELLKKIENDYPQANDNDVTGDNIYDEFDLENSERHEKIFTFYYNNYKIVYNYIDGSGDQSEITIYDVNNTKVYYNEDIKTTIIVEDENEELLFLNFLPTISNGKLNILSYNPDKCYMDEFEEYWPYFEYRQVDLSSSQISEETIVSVKYVADGFGRECKN